MFYTFIRRWRIRRNYKKLYKRMSQERVGVEQWEEARKRWAINTNSRPPEDNYLRSLREKELGNE